MHFWVKIDSLPRQCITREGIKPDPEKVQDIVDIGQPSTTTEAKLLIVMVQY